MKIILPVCVQHQMDIQSKKYAEAGSLNIR